MGGMKTGLARNCCERDSSLGIESEEELKFTNHHTSNKDLDSSPDVVMVHFHAVQLDQFQTGHSRGAEHEVYRRDDAARTDFPGMRCAHRQNHRWFGG